SGGRGSQIWLAGDAPYYTRVPGGDLLGAGHIAIMPTPGSKYSWTDSSRPWSADLSPVPDWAVALKSAPSNGADAPAVLMTSTDIMSLLGRLRRDRLGCHAMLAVLLSMYGTGEIT